MNKLNFILQLQDRLEGLPRVDLEERLMFYSEMIDDRMEEGLSEEDAVASVGSIDEIVTEIVAEYPITKLVKSKVKPRRRMKAWEILLLVLGFPVWLPLLIATFAVVFSLYITLWSIVISFWAAALSIAVSAMAGIIAGLAFSSAGDGLPGMALLAAGLACAGLSIFCFYGCKAATKGTALLAKKTAVYIKRCIVHKEGR